LGDWSNGLKWPIVESYAVAGRTPAQAVRAVSLFNLAWAPLMPIGVLVTGPLIEWTGPGMFLTGALLSAPSLWLCSRLRARPTHLLTDHPDRPDAEAMAHIKSLLTSSRWSLFAAYLLLQVLVPLLPGLLAGMGYSVQDATPLASLLELGRLF